MMEDFASLPPDLFTVHERAFLEERCVQFASSGANAGTFELINRPEYRRLEDKILFLIAKFSNIRVDKGSGIWQRFEQSKTIRDRLTHPRKKTDLPLSAQDAKNAIEVAKEIIQLVSTGVWGKKVDF
jgi:hypothetical protein